MLIGIIGFAGSGKGTIGDILTREYDFVRLSFADAVKDTVSQIFGWPRELLEGDTVESRQFRETVDVFWSARFGYDVTPRAMLQKMGTEAGRDVFHKDIWIHTVERRIKNMQEWEYKTDFVIPDVRFPNEVDFINNSGGFVVRVVRGPNPEWYDIALMANRQNKPELMKNYPVHYSEWAWIGQNCNYLLHNVGSITMLEADVKHMLKIFRGPAII
jgi:hypothetical protein